jgi:hypothetical protein
MKLESRRKPRKSHTVWNFEQTSDEQLLRLESLLKSDETAKAAEYSEQLINSGFLSYRIVEV